MSKIVIGTKNYVANSFRSDAVGFAGPAQTAVHKDVLVQKATPPKPTTLFSGVSRSSAKFTRTLVLQNALTPAAEAICEVSVSLPAGSTVVDVTALLDDVKAYVATADFRKLVSDGMVAPLV